MSSAPRSLRERAAQADRLARDVGDETTRAALRQLADELREQADRQERDQEFPSS